ncbi:hypothetical protein F2P79_025207 [Pimephales promelas]|nr:hypothetical protein F2P79_025207 [Pimephales promelas]
MAGYFAEIILTQSPSVNLVSVGSSVTLNCRSSSSSFQSSLVWYHHRPGQTHKLLFTSVGNKVSGVSERFTDGRSGTNFMLNIRNVQPEDAGDYYCQQHYNYPLTQNSQEFVYKAWRSTGVGGEVNVLVHIDESKFCHKRKYARGRFGNTWKRKRTWVFGIQYDQSCKQMPHSSPCETRIPLLPSSGNMFNVKV